jgi:hypothetical protein
MWFSGPEWLVKGDFDVGEGPQRGMPDDCATELRSVKREKAHGLLSISSGGLSEIIATDRYSSLTKLLWVTAYVLQAIDKFNHRANEALPYYLRAETLWIKEVQSVMASDGKMDEWKKQLGLFLDGNGIWRCGGRLTFADLPYETKHPILLPRDHHFTILVVRWAHDRVLHNGMRETLTQIRSRYWIIRGRALVKKIVHQCVLCRRFESPPYRAPPPPPLPAIRVMERPPFSFVGVDFAGPIFIKQNGGVKKTWIVLYTCCVVRAVHLDVVVDLSTPSFIRSFKRFTARRGLPIQMLSDNGKTFKAAAKYIKGVMTDQTVKQYLSDQRVNWRFNMERAAWWGGVFERMIGCMKRCLRKMIGRATLTYEELLTAVTEVEMVLNSRPLSFVSPQDHEEPLTPSHLLTGRRLLGLPDNLCHETSLDTDFELNPNLINKRMRHLNRTLEHFWKRWKSEYLIGLRETHKASGRTTDPCISIGDVVVVHDDSKKRGFWSLGKVEELIHGTDGHVRGAVLSTYVGGNQTKFLRRSISHLYPLEVNANDFKNSVTTPAAPSSMIQEESNPVGSTLPGESISVEGTVVNEPSPEFQASRPRRRAATEARDRIVAQNLQYHHD